MSGLFYKRFLTERVLFCIHEHSDIYLKEKFGEAKKKKDIVSIFHRYSARRQGVIYFI